MTEVYGPDFITLLVADLDASLRFYKDRIGLKTSPEKQPHAQAFDTKPCGLAIRQSSEKVAIPGQGVIIWLRTSDATALCRALKVTSKPSPAIGRAGTASGSMTSIGSASSGTTAGRSKSRWWTTTDGGRDA